MEVGVRYSASRVRGTKRTGTIVSSRSSRRPLAHDHQLLRQRADRNDHAPAGLELLDQRRRDVVGRRGDDDGVERRRLRPAHVAVADARLDVRIAEPRQRRRRLAARGCRRSRCCGPCRRSPPAPPPGSRSRFRSRAPWLRAELQQVGHQRHDVGLRDRLPLADRQRPVAVGGALLLAGTNSWRGTLRMASSTRSSSTGRPVSAAMRASLTISSTIWWRSAARNSSAMLMPAGPRTPAPARPRR